MSISRTDLVNKVATSTGLRKLDAESAFDVIFEEIATGLAQRTDVRIVGFGTFKVAHRAASTGRNPRTGEKIDIAASDTARFVPGKALKDSLNPAAPSVPRRRQA